MITVHWKEGRTRHTYWLFLFWMAISRWQSRQP